MTDIVLCTANARFAHASLGLRCLLANLGELRTRAMILEVTLEDRARDIAEKILAQEPRIVGLGVYIWNVDLMAQVAGVLRRVAPQVKLVLGGPEVSCPSDLPAMASLGHHVVCGEGEERFASLCQALLDGLAPPFFWDGPPPDLLHLAFPYELYDEADLAHRWTYIETTRGCPHGCEFCLSALDRKVRRFPAQGTAHELTRLLQRGARKLKVLDRTILPRQLRLLADVVRPYAHDGLFLHLEAVPDRLTDRDLELLAEFPKGAVQIEAGIQSLDSAVLKRISRKQSQAKALERLRTLLERTFAHVHADLVVGLPGETMDSLATGFDSLLETGVHEIQVGMLKRLRGAPIARHEGPFDLRFEGHAPYEILATSTIDFDQMQRLRRLSRVFDLVHNSGRFRGFCKSLVHGRSAFEAHLALADSVQGRAGRTAKLSLSNFAGYLFDHATLDLGKDPRAVAEMITSDLERTSREAPPARVQQHLDPQRPRASRAMASDLPQRQSRHREDRCPSVGE
ncbi:MAG: DUF4080 domain-containing protein [Myxococcota bacterium]|jgi:radical SAM superfamily enzyme YgiQ (UPF0313 family)|nr:DUF4080 domain-containing protein [Myxococcota bacterium]